MNRKRKHILCAKRNICDRPAHNKGEQDFSPVPLSKDGSAMNNNANNKVKNSNNNYRSKNQNQMENKAENCKHGHCDKDKHDKSYH